MSGPMSNLRKARKPPFHLTPASPSPGPGNHGVPFRSLPVDEDALLDEITSNMSRPRGAPVPPPGGRQTAASPSLPKLDHTPRAQKNSNGTAPSDTQLMSIMMARLAQAEQRAQQSTKEIIDKDKKIRILEEKVKILQKARDGDSDGSRVQDLEKKCLHLQRQVHEMESFLSDYGMVWVGQKEKDTYVSDGENEEDLEEEEEPMWRPDSSLANSEDTYNVKFDQIIENVRELNVLAGEGVSKIQHTIDGARLKMPDAVPLTLYANGLVMYSGPFRPYTDPTTRQCVADLTDGFFPSELQARYPDGVPLSVTDKRGVYFRDKRHEVLFQGVGQMLGGETQPSRLVPTNLNQYDKQKQAGKEAGTQGDMEEETVLPGAKLSMEQFLNKLPSSVIKNGKVIDVRNSLATSIQGSSTPAEVTVVETAAVDEMKSRLAREENDRPPSSRDVTTLRVKDETGDHTYIIKMKFNETIGDLRKYLNKQRAPGTGAYDIVSTFPHRSYKDQSATLQDCGLVPNAALHLKPCRD